MRTCSAVAQDVCAGAGFVRVSWCTRINRYCPCTRSEGVSSSSQNCPRVSQRLHAGSAHSSLVPSVSFLRSNTTIRAMVVTR